MFHSQTKRSTAAQVAFFLFFPFETHSLSPERPHCMPSLGSQPHRQGRGDAKQNYLRHDKFYGDRKNQVYANPARMESEHCSGGLN